MQFFETFVEIYILTKKLLKYVSFYIMPEKHVIFACTGAWNCYKKICFIFVTYSY